MGGSNSCCAKPESKHTSPATQQNRRESIGEGNNLRKNSQKSTVAHLSAAEPHVESKQDMKFPRYSVLPSIDVAKQPIIGCSNGDVLAHGDSSSIMNLYNRYVDRELGFISAEGIEQLCNDLELSPEDFRILVLAYGLGAEVMCRFTEEEFVQGCKKLGITDMPSMKASIPSLLQSVTGKGFPPFYRWTYKFGLDTENGQRTLPTDLAISLWKLVFTQNVPALLGKWLTFLEENPSIKGISKDTWDMFLIFVDQIKGDLTLYDDTEAWPSLLDEFVEHELANASQNTVVVQV